MLSVKPVTVKESRADTSPLSNQSLHLPGNWSELETQKKSGEFLLPVGTDWVSRDVMGVSEEVNRISQGKCRVASCQCGKCLDKGHFPHIILEIGKSGRTYPVFGFTHFGPHVVQRLQEIHASQNPNKKSMDNNQKILKTRRSEALDAQREKLDIVGAALNSHKFNWRGPDGIRTRA